MNLLSNLKLKSEFSPVFQRVVKAVFFGIGGSVASRALLLFSGIMLSHILGKEIYGQFNLVNSTVTLFVTFSGMGIGATLTRYVSLYRSQPEILGNIIGTLSTFVGFLSIVMSLSLLLLSDQLSSWVSGTNALSGYFSVAALTIFFSSLASIQQSILLGMEKYKVNAKIELIRTAFYLVIIVVFSNWTGIYGAIWALLVTYILQFYLMYIESRKEYKARSIILSLKFNLDIRNIIWNFTIPAFIASLFVIPVNWINNSILTKYVGFGELAVFSVALQWMTIITYIPSQMGQVRPIYTDLFAQKKYYDMKKIFSKITFGAIIIVIPIALLGAIFSKLILSLYGDGYESGYFTFILMMVTAVLITLQSQIGAILQSIGRMWAGFALNLIWSTIMVGVFYYLRALGSIGYAIGYCTSYGIHMFLSFAYICFIWKRREISW